MHSKIEHIFLDMDGVLCDFARAALQVNGKPNALADWPKGERDFPKVLGFSRGEYWRAIDNCGSTFWASLEPYAWFDELIDLVRLVAPFSILTAASLSPSCLEGKVNWLYHHFPKQRGRAFRDYLIGNQKFLLAQPNRLLIDDAESNVKEFRAAGGHAILFPQVWNRNHDVSNPIAFIKSEIEAIGKLESLSPKAKAPPIQQG